MDLSNFESTFVHNTFQTTDRRMQHGRPVWTIPEAVRALTDNYEEADDILRSRPHYIRYTAAYRDDTIYALQECDWDEYDMSVWLGKSIVSAALLDEEADELTTWLADRTLRIHYEDLF